MNHVTLTVYAPPNKKRISWDKKKEEWPEWHGNKENQSADEIKGSSVWRWRIEEFGLYEILDSYLLVEIKN